MPFAMILAQKIAARNLPENLNLIRTTQNRPLVVIPHHLRVTKKGAMILLDEVHSVNHQIPDQNQKIL